MKKRFQNRRDSFEGVQAHLVSLRTALQTDRLGSGWSGRRSPKREYEGPVLSNFPVLIQPWSKGGEEAIINPAPQITEAASVLESWTGPGTKILALYTLHSFDLKVCTPQKAVLDPRYQMSVYYLVLSFTQIPSLFILFLLKCKVNALKKYHVKKPSGEQ